MKEIISIGIILCLACMAAAAPNLNLTQLDCERCHGTNVANLHHSSGQDCVDCHINDDGEWVDTSTCFSCHAEFDHHEDAAGQCNRCHDDRQHHRRRGR